MTGPSHAIRKSKGRLGEHDSLVALAERRFGALCFITVALDMTAVSSTRLAQSYRTSEFCSGVHAHRILYSPWEVHKSKTGPSKSLSSIQLR